MMSKYIVNIIFLIIYPFFSYSQVSICSWNIQNFGKSKDATEIEYIANTIKMYDAVAIIEVVAGNGGAQAVARLHDALNRKGFKWDYVVSDPTSSIGRGSERYAVLWKTKKITKIGAAWLEKKYSDEIEREPFYITFKSGTTKFTLAVFHAVPTSKKPEIEIKYLQHIPDEYPQNNIVFCGDYNCSQSNKSFKELKEKGYKPILIDQKTSLRNKCIEDDCLASEYDNMFYKPSKIKFLKSGIIPFYLNFTTIKEAKEISDHVPIFFEFYLN
jgi:deoxyribonuclease-1-like protein